MFRWRVGFLAIALTCSTLVGFALYLQYSEFANPCPLCILQRAAWCLCGLIALLAALFPLSRFNWLWPCMLSLAAMVGAGTALRHIMIQFYLDPTNLPSCGAGILFMLQKYPLFDVLKSAFYGAGECVIVDHFLGIPIPIFSLLGFIVILIAGWGVWYYTSQKSCSKPNQSSKPNSNSKTTYH